MNKIVLVTGGLSGIGKGAVMELAKKHYKIIIFDRNNDKAPEVIKQAQSNGAEEVTYHKVNIISSE